MAQDRKYGYVTTEHGDIGQDEPVVVFRAQDGLLTNLLGYYRQLCELNGSPRQHLDMISRAIDWITEWQENPDNYVKTVPTSGGPAGVAQGLISDADLQLPETQGLPMGDYFDHRGYQ